MNAWNEYTLFTRRTYENYTTVSLTALCVRVRPDVVCALKMPVSRISFACQMESKRVFVYGRKLVYLQHINF